MEILIEIQNSENDENSLLNCPGMIRVLIIMASFEKHKIAAYK